MSAKTGKTQVFVILSSFCDLVHIQSVIELFGKPEVNISSYPATEVAGLFFFVVQKY